MYRTALSLFIILGLAIAGPVQVEKTSQVTHQAKHVPIKAVRSYLNKTRLGARGLVNEFQGVIESSPQGADVDHHRHIAKGYLPKAIQTIVAMREAADSMLRRIDENGLESPQFLGGKQDCHQLKKSIDAIKEMAIENLCSQLKRQEIIAYFKSDLNCLLGSIFELWRATERDGSYLTLGYREIIQTIKNLLVTIETGTRRFAEEINYMDFSNECQKLIHPAKTLKPSVNVQSQPNVESKAPKEEGKKKKNESKDEGKGVTGSSVIVAGGAKIGENSLVEKVEKVIKLEQKELDDIKTVAKKELEKVNGTKKNVNVGVVGIIDAKMGEKVKEVGMAEEKKEEAKKAEAEKVVVNDDKKEDKENGEKVGEKAAVGLLPIAASANKTGNLLPTAVETNITANLLPTTTGNKTTGNLLPTAAGNKTTGNLLPTAAGNKTTGNLLPPAAGNKTIGNLLPTAAGNKTIGNLLPTAAGNKTIGNLLPTAAGNKTIGNLLPTAASNKTIGNLLPTAAGNKTIANLLPTAAGNKTSESLLPTAAINKTTVNHTSEDVGSKLKVILVKEENNLNAVLKKLDENNQTTAVEAEKVEEEKKEIKKMQKELEKVIADVVAIEALEKNKSAEIKEAGNNHGKISIIDVMTQNPIVSPKPTSKMGMVMPKVGTTVAPAHVFHSLTTGKLKLPQQALTSPPTNLKDVENEEKSLENLRSFGKDFLPLPTDKQSDQVLNSSKTEQPKTKDSPATGTAVEINDIDAMEERDEEEAAREMVKKAKEEEEKKEQLKEAGEKKVANGKNETKVEEEKKEMKKAEQKKETTTENKPVAKMVTTTSKLLPVAAESKNSTVDGLISHINDEEDEVRNLIQKLNG